jgi:hypothetical protein
MMVLECGCSWIGSTPVSSEDGPFNHSCKLSELKGFCNVIGCALMHCLDALLDAGVGAQDYERGVFPSGNKLVQEL